jgi:hypothetical protein
MQTFSDSNSSKLSPEPVNQANSVLANAVLAACGFAL